MAPDTFNSLDTILNQITTTNSPVALNHTLRNSIPKEARETILSSLLSGGQDPLSVLDMRENTLGALFILSARFHNTNAVPPPWPLVQEFCHTFNPDHARLAPDRVTLLARGISFYADQSNNVKAAIQPLYDLVRRYPPHPSYLTTIHPIFVMACVTSQHYSEALPILQHPITNIDTNLSDLTYNDNLLYHYTGGIALAALKRWNEAEEFFEICVSSPGSVPAALQLEAFKKLKLVQLISTGQASGGQKYAHPVLSRLFKNSPYSLLVNAYPHNKEHLQEVLEKERNLFSTEKNIGLVTQAIERAPRWALKKLTATYVTLGLSDIARAIGITEEEEVRALILSMIESNDISAQISSNGTVTFTDPPPQFTKEQVDKVLEDVQVQTAMLNALEMEMSRSKEFLSKAVKSRDDSAWIPSAEEDMYNAMGGGSNWVEDAIFS
ncbi:hypothetical protein BDZ94DRAFT_1338265 [Collybia nuda]|uniref:COP9 signalosome complex subunit 3 n=1 Tax=Collybia nuda TaxID=64659 RepID=A0A9P6CE68_9AGAR|nr:hypothetical protein BDZ94DRAFT_1338265 [Collybia nuda]